MRLLLLVLLLGCAPPPDPLRAEGLLAEAFQAKDRAPLLAQARALAPESAAVRGGALYLEGDLEGAARQFRDALKDRGNDEFRRSDLLMALGWIAWRQRDVAAAADLHRQAADVLRRVPSVPEAWNPRFELLAAYLEVMDGAPPPAPREGLYERLRRERVPEDPEFRVTRETLSRALSAPPDEALAILEDQLDLEGEVEGTRDEPDSERRRSFFSELQEEQDGVLYRLLLGDLHARAGRPEEARRWYAQALERVPDHPTIAARLNALSTPRP